jgi:hypothetical protein
MFSLVPDRPVGVARSQQYKTNTTKKHRLQNLQNDKNNTSTNTTPQDLACEARQILWFGIVFVMV